MTPEKAVDNEVLDVEPLPHDIDQSDDWKKILNVIEDRFTKIEDALIGLKMQQLSSKNQNVLDNVETSEKDLVINFLKKKISDLENEHKQKNVVIDYLHSQ